MAPRDFQRPENAIAKADEFINVGRPLRALEALYEVIKGKKRTSHTYPEKLLEKIMYKYLELCVELRKSHMAKEALFQYRNMCHLTDVNSLANVVSEYLNMAERRTDEARQESVDSVQEVDDLENLATPEMIMLSAVSGEDAQDRSDRKILMPWVKFLWESYCQCLELLRTNSRVEMLYHEIAQRNFKFCLKYGRKTEFRKLCDKLRNHLELINKQTQTSTSINLSAPETQQHNLDTRLVQLDAAIQMELWQEAYKAVEDIHGLMALSKRVFPPKMMANYYQKLALVFWKSGNHLFHAAAIFKHFQLTREMKKNISAEELGRMASRVLVACMSVPIPSQHPEFDRFIETDRTPAEKQARLAVLLGLQQPPTRASLLKDAERFGVVAAALPQIRELHHNLEVDFSPLKLCARIEKSVSYIQEGEELSALQLYIPSLKDVTLVRLLKQISQVYRTICFQRLLELAPFANGFELERVIVDCVRHNDMQIRVDHRLRQVHFGTDLAESQGYDVAEGPHLQDMPSEQIRTQLMRMAEVLDKSLKTIHPEKVKNENQKIRTKIVDAYHGSKDREHQRILARHKIIEERKVLLEKLSMHRQEEEQRKQQQQLQEKQKQEDERLAVERQKLQEAKDLAQLQAIQAKHREDKLNQIGQTEIGKKILSKMDEDDIADQSVDQILAMQVEELEKEKKELMARLKSQEKKVDHMERAKRREEIPLLKEAFEVDEEDDKVMWKAKEQDRIKQAIIDRENAVKTRDRLFRMKDDKEAYLDKLLKERKAAFTKKLSDFNAKLERERVLRLEERKKNRKEDRRKKWIKEKEEEAQRKRDEETKRQREEEERQKAEQLRKEKEDYQKRQEELEVVEAKKRQRELEMEQKLKMQEEQTREKMRSAREPRDKSAKERSDHGNWRQRDEADHDRESDKNRDGFHCFENIRYRGEDRGTGRGMDRDKDRGMGRGLPMNRASIMKGNRDRDVAHDLRNLRDRDAGHEPKPGRERSDWRSRDDKDDMPRDGYKRHDGGGRFTRGSGLNRDRPRQGPRDFGNRPARDSDNWRARDDVDRVDRHGAPRAGHKN